MSNCLCRLQSVQRSHTHIGTLFWEACQHVLTNFNLTAQFARVRVLYFLHWLCAYWLSRATLSNLLKTGMACCHSLFGHRYTVCWGRLNPKLTLGISISETLSGTLKHFSVKIIGVNLEKRHCRTMSCFCWPHMKG